MEIYRPVKSRWLTQKFGENKACITTSGKIVGKVDGFCPPGSKNFYKSLGMKGHNGYDHATWYREPVFFNVQAPTTWYARTEMDSAGGLGVDIFSKEALDFPFLPSHTGPEAQKKWGLNGGKIHVKFRFWHADANAVAENQVVKIGDFIQYSDSTGASGGNHVHWSMKFVDENGNTLDRDNGYTGAVGHSVYYKDIFIGDFMQIKKKVLTLKEQVDKLVFNVTMFINNLKK